MKKNYFILLSLAVIACGKEEKKQETVVTETKVEVPATPAMRYGVGDELFVLAEAGLNLRDSAYANATKVTKVPYGASVKVLADELGITPYSVEEFKGFTIDGHWVKVDYGGKVGFLFDGYLSKWAAPNKETFTFTEYLNKTSKQVKSDKNKPPKANPQDAELFDYEHTEYADGTQFTMKAYEGGANDEIRFPKGKITFTEAYLIMKAITTSTKTGPCKYEASPKRIACERETDLVEVMEENGQIVAKFSVAD